MTASRIEALVGLLLLVLLVTRWRWIEAGVLRVADAIVAGVRGIGRRVRGSRSGGGAVVDDTRPRARVLPVGGWLAEAMQRYEGLFPSELVAAAIHRVRFDEVLASTVTYLGQQPRPNPAQRISASSPSRLTVSATSRNGVRVALGDFTLGANRTWATDWAFHLSVSDDLSRVTLELLEARRHRVSMENEPAFEQVVEAVAGAVDSGVRIRPGRLDEVQLARWEAPVLAGLVPDGERLVIDPAVGTSINDLLEEHVSPSLRGGRIGWPLVGHTGEVYASSTLEIQLVGAALSALRAQARHGGAVAPGAALDEAIETIRLGFEPVFGDAPDHAVFESIDPASAVLPFRLALAEGDVEARSLIAAAACRPAAIEWRSATQPGAPAWWVPMQAQLVAGMQSEVGYGLSPGVYSPVLGVFFDQAVQPADWVVGLSRSSGAGGGQQVVLRALTHSAYPFVHGGHALLDLLGELTASGAGELLVIDRGHPWS